MAATDNERQTRRAGSLGAVSLRLVVALGASTGLTAAVALPMAYQAQQAREQDAISRQGPAQPGVEVLGTTTVPDTAVDHDGLFWAPAEGRQDRAELHRSTLSGEVRIVLDLPDVERVDFRLDDGGVLTVTSAPWWFPEQGTLDTATLADGEHVVLATIEFDDGRNELRRAEFTVSTG